MTPFVLSSSMTNVILPPHSHNTKGIQIAHLPSHVSQLVIESQNTFMCHEAFVTNKFYKILNGVIHYFCTVVV